MNLPKMIFVTVAMEEFYRYSPGGAKALIGERDAFMSYNLIRLSHENERVLAVVGAGHRKGIEGYLADPLSLPPVEKLTSQIKTRPWGLIFGNYRDCSLCCFSCLQLYSPEWEQSFCFRH